MRIIDNKKDYYDYLMGVYGIDDMVVYDRRGSTVFTKTEFEKLFIPHSDNQNIYAKEVIVKIGNKVYYFNRKNGDDDWTMPNEIDYYRHIEKDANPCLLSNFKSKLKDDAPIELYYCYANPWRTYNIFKEKYRHLVTNPILKEFSFITKHIPADDIWQLVYDWITKRNEPNVVDNRTDKEHIQSAGFDCKTSFRNIK